MAALICWPFCNDWQEMMKQKIKHSLFFNLSGKQKPIQWLEFDTLHTCSNRRLNYRGTGTELKGLCCTFLKQNQSNLHQNNTKADKMKSGGFFVCVCLFC